MGRRSGDDREVRPNRRVPNDRRGGRRRARQRPAARVERPSRLRQYGPNELETEKPVPAWRRFLAQFEDVLIILLLVATAISVGLWVYERDTALPYEGLTIFAIVLLNGILGYVQETRAEQAVAALRAMSANEATVLRDGERQSVPAAELVPGDVVLIEEGDTIPADARLIGSTALQTMEASLTGESVPVSKDVSPVEEEVGLGDRRNMVFSGTASTYGRGKAVVTATGMRTELGNIAGLLSRTEEQTTPLQKELDGVSKLLGGIVIIIAVVVVVTIVLVEGIRDPAAILDVLIFGVALAVAAVPEGLPAIVTTTLALGVRRMAGRSPILAIIFRSWALGSIVFGLGAIVLGIRQVRLGAHRGERFIGVALLLGGAFTAIEGLVRLLFGVTP